MKSFNTAGRAFYGVGIAGIGILHFLYAGFRPVILPVPPEATQHVSILVYLTGAFLIAAGLAIKIGFKINLMALLLAVILLLFIIAGHLPNRLMYMPGVLGAWTDALKLLALSGGAFIAAEIYQSAQDSSFVSSLNRFSFIGKYFFGLMFIIFGIDHFVYTDFVKALVPGWIPGALFWTYFAGIALIGAGLALIINFKVKAISLLTAVMLFLWMMLLHVPRAVAADNSKDPNEIVSVFECLSFCGISLMLTSKKKTVHKRLRIKANEK